MTTLNKAEKNKLEKGIKKMREAYEALDQMNDVLSEHGYIKDHENDPSIRLQLKLKEEASYWDQATWWNGGQNE